MINQCRPRPTKFEVSRFTRCEAMNADAKCTNSGSWGRLWVTQGHRQCHHSIDTYDFIFDFNRNHASILYRFRDIAGYLSKVADFDPPHLHLAPPQGVIPVEFRGDLWYHKTSLPELSCGIVYVILCLAVLVEHRLITDRHRRTQDNSIYRASIASRGKNQIWFDILSS